MHGLFEEDDNRYAERSYRWTDTFFKEKLTLFSNGYVYHPRFLLFHAAVTGLVSQERYDTSLAPSDEWRRDDGFEYDFSLLLLPEHAYNLQALCAALRAALHRALRHPREQRRHQPTAPTSAIARSRTSCTRATATRR